MSEIDTFGITLPVTDWRTLFDLSQRADRAPSDYLRLLIRREIARELHSTEGSERHPPTDITELEEDSLSKIEEEQHQLG